MKKIILSAIAALPFLAINAYAYNLPQTEIRIPALKREYVKIESFINATFDNKIKTLSREDKATFDNKIHSIQNIFINIEYLALNKKKQETIGAVNELKIDLKDLLFFLKSAKSENKAIKPQSLISETPVDLNKFSNEAKYGEITYYSDAFEGGKTSNGNLFSQKFFSTAKCSTAFNMLTQVWTGNKSIIVKVNDRPNCTKYPNLIDLTTTAFDFLHERYVGKQKGEYIELASVPADYYKRYIPSGLFEDNSIALAQNVPNTFLQNETMHINGELSLPNRKISITMTSPSGKIRTVTKYVEKGFTFSYILDEIGKYSLKSDLSDETFAIYVLDPGSYSGKKFVSNVDFKKLDSLDIAEEKDDKGTYAYRLRIPGNDFNSVSLEQGGKKYYYSGVGDVLIPNNIIDKAAPVAIQIKSAKTLTNFSHDFYTEPFAIFNSIVTMR